ncbi:hypothetical protein [Bradyrhizobium sp. UFLA05-112]
MRTMIDRISLRVERKRRRRKAGAAAAGSLRLSVECDIWASSTLKVRLVAYSGAYRLDLPQAGLAGVWPSTDERA